MKIRACYSFACAAFAALVAAGGLAGCFSEHVAFTPPTGQDLCVGAQAANVVRIVDFGFSPATVTIPVGGKVTWVNCSAASTVHTSTADAGAWASGSLAQYVTYERTFDAAGDFPFHCDPHPFMKGTIVVQ